MPLSSASRVPVYLAAGTPPFLASLFWLSQVPPLWHHVDSTVLILWAPQMVPHHAPIYPTLLHILTLWIGMNATMINVVLALQHVLFFGAVVYLATAFIRPLHAFIMATAAV